MISAHDPGDEHQEAEKPSAPLSPEEALEALEAIRIFAGCLVELPDTPVSSHAVAYQLQDLMDMDWEEFDT